jgi:hypothetical protein
MSQFNEPWKFNTNYIETTRPGGYVVGETVSDLDDSERAHEFGPRIVACVNALAGVADPAALVAMYDEMWEFISTVNTEIARDLIERARRAKGEK